MTPPRAGRAGRTGPVLAGILALPSAEDVLRSAFDQAHDRTAGLRVLAAGLGPVDTEELTVLVDKWAGKFPDVPVSVSAQGAIDPAITVTAATRDCAVAVLGRPAGVRAAAVVRAIKRRARCPVLLA